jgi:hypothetical protein
MKNKKISRNKSRLSSNSNQLDTITPTASNLEKRKTINKTKSPKFSSNFEEYKNTFSGLYFLGNRDNSDYKKANIIIFPIGYEGTCSYGLGTKKGPKAIL